MPNLNVLTAVVAFALAILGCPINAWSVTTNRPLPFLPDMEVSSNVNYAGHGNAVDFLYKAGGTSEAGRGLPLVAAQAGYVAVSTSSPLRFRDYGFWESTCNGGWGNTVVICSDFTSSDIAEVTCERYAHMRDIFVLPGQYVSAGQVIGLMGDNGISTAPHLHSQIQSRPRGAGIQVAASYVYKTSINGSPTQGLSVSSPCNNEESDCYYSTNSSLFTSKTSGISSADLGTWQSYGWLTSYTRCDDEDDDEYFDCHNERVHRLNAYVSRFSGGSYSQTYVVYDALSGASTPYIVRSAMLSGGSNGWNSSGQAGPTYPIVGMPIEDQRSTATGADQCFQWGCLRWDSAINAVFIAPYPQAAMSAPADQNPNRSVGPGVYAPNQENGRTVHHWDRSTSYKFVDAWNRNSGANALGYPASDNNADPGVHQWYGTRFLVQNFTGGTLGDSAIMYDPQNWLYGKYSVGGGVPNGIGWNRAYVIRSGFWQWYRYNNGIHQLKAPLGDEASGAQQFLCGWLEWNANTHQVVPHIESNRPGCSTSTIPDYNQAKTGFCYNKPNAEPLAERSGLPTGGGSTEPLSMMISCSKGPADTSVSITGPIMDGLETTISGQTMYLEYASSSDGTAPYLSGKPRLTWMGDTQPNGLLRTYYLIVGATVLDMELFLYNPNSNSTAFFDHQQWTVIGDCYDDNGTIRIRTDEPGVQGPCTVGDRTCTDTGHYAVCQFDQATATAYWDNQACSTGMQCLSNGTCTASAPQCSYGAYTCTSSSSTAICIDGQWQYYNCASDSECLSANGFCSVKPQVCQANQSICTSGVSIAFCQIDSYTGEASWMFSNCAAGWECLSQNGCCSVKPAACAQGERTCITGSQLAVCTEDASSSEFYVKTYDCEEGYTCDSALGKCVTVNLPVPMDSGHTIRCENLGNKFIMTFSGAIQDGLWGNVSGEHIYLEYGSYADGWASYTPSPSSKPYAEWMGDTDANGEPVAYQVEMGGYVDEMNFFLYSPDTTQQQWFNLDWSIWGVVGDCYQQGSSLRHNPLPPAAGTITCTQEGSSIRYSFDGPMLELLVGDASGEPLEVQYGSNTDGWTVPTTGKATSPWLGTNHHEIVLPASVNVVNFYLHAAGGGAWFDLVDADWDNDSWSVTGDCYRSGGGILH